MTVVKQLLRLVPILLVSSHLIAQLNGSEETVKFYAEVPQLEESVHQALRRNPRLEQALARYRAALQKIPQVTALPEPMLMFTQFIRDIETRVGPQLNSLALSQNFPWFGNLDLKGRVAFKEAAALYQTYRAREREIILQVKSAFYELGYVERTLEIIEEERSLLTHYEQLAQARYAAGEEHPQAIIKIQAEITQIIIRLKMFRQHRMFLTARMNTLMNKPPQGSFPKVDPLSLPHVDLHLQELYELGDKNRQELKAAMAHIEKNEQAVELARKDYWPNLTLAAGMTNVGGRGDPIGLLLPPPDNGKNAYNFSIGINIPLRRNKYDAGVLEATESLIAERRSYASIRNEMHYSIREQMIRLQTLQEQMDLLAQVLMPQADEALRSAESAYQTGQANALSLLDSERFRLELRLLGARYHSDYLRALANLERAVGTQFPRE